MGSGSEAEGDYLPYTPAPDPPGVVNPSDSREEDRPCDELRDNLRKCHTNHGDETTDASGTNVDVSTACQLLAIETDACLNKNHGYLYGTIDQSSSPVKAAEPTTPEPTTQEPTMPEP